MQKAGIKVTLKPLEGVVNDFRGNYVKLSSVRPEITKPHFQRVSLGLDHYDAFKITNLDFESKKTLMRQLTHDRKI